MTALRIGKLGTRMTRFYKSIVDIFFFPQSRNILLQQCYDIIYIYIYIETNDVGK